jgi:hypothetical protein
MAAKAWLIEPTHLPVIPVVGFQNLLVGLEAIRVIRLDHPLEAGWRVGENIRAGLFGGQIGRDGMLVQVLFL